MEKKNTILLTVIAIATLLVAVVGATFAYFTAQVNTTGTAGNEKVEVKTYALTGVTMERGSKAKSEGMYPGSKLAKDFTIKAECPTDSTTCEDVYTTLTITVNNPLKDGSTTDTVFGDHISWKLYKMASKTDEVTCDAGTTNNAGGKYFVSGVTCTNTEADKLVAQGTATDTYDITAVGYTDAAKGKTQTDDKYYLVVEYVNDTEHDQNGEQGQSFDVTLTYDVKTAQS